MRTLARIRNNNNLIQLISHNMTLKREHCKVSQCNKLLEPYEIFYLNNDKRDSTISNPYCEFDFNHQLDTWNKIKHKYRPL